MQVGHGEAHTGGNPPHEGRATDRLAEVTGITAHEAPQNHHPQPTGQTQPYSKLRLQPEVSQCGSCADHKGRHELPNSHWLGVGYSSEQSGLAGHCLLVGVHASSVPNGHRVWQQEAGEDAGATIPSLDPGSRQSSVGVGRLLGSSPPIHWQGIPPAQSTRPLPLPRRPFPRTSPLRNRLRSPHPSRFPSSS